VASAVAASGTADKCTSPSAALNEPTITLRITGGKWKGKLTLPESATVGDLKCLLAASSKIPEGSQQLIFRGKKMLDLEKKVVELGLKNKSAVYLRLIKQPIKSLAPTDEELQIKAASDLRERLAAQGAGMIASKTAEQYIQLVSKGTPATETPVLDAVKLFYKSSGKIQAARNIQSVEAATKRATSASAASASKNSTAAVAKVESTESGKAKGAVLDTQETEPKKKKKKKKKTYKQLMKAVILTRQTSDERRKAHEKYLKKNLGGGDFDKLDKI